MINNYTCDDLIVFIKGRLNDSRNFKDFFLLPFQKTKKH